MVCITGQYSQKQKDTVIVQTSFWLPIVIVVIHTSVSENIGHQLYSDTHHREITVNTREDATEITIPWFNTNLIFLQCDSVEFVVTCGLLDMVELQKGYQVS